MRKINIAAVTALALALGIVAGPAISAGTSNSISACVSKSTGNLRISKKCKSTEKPLNWNIQGVAGPSGPVGLQGPPGRDGLTFIEIFPGDTCGQKLSLAEAMGQKISFKNQRDKFEQITGCEVEKILGTQNENLKNSNLPYISKLKLLGLFESGSGGGSVLDLPGSRTFRIEYEISIERLASAEVRNGGPLNVCTTNDEGLVNIDRPQSVSRTDVNNVFIYSTYLEASLFENSFKAPLYVGLCDAGSEWMVLPMYVTVNEDPSLLTSNQNPGFESQFAEVWGW